MTIYVDTLFTMPPRTAQARKFGNQWSHMTCDGNIEELHRMAEKIGLKRSYFQDHAQWYLKHYDLTPSKRALAVAHGAIEVDMVTHIREMSRREKAGEP